MDFDEYEYLEKAVENPEPGKGKETTNGDDEVVKSAEKERSRSSKHRSDDKDDARHSKRSKSGEDSRDRDRRKERDSSHHRSGSRDGERDRHRSSREHRSKDREERNGKERDRERDREKRERDRDGEKERDKEKSRRGQSHLERQRSERDEREKSRDKEPRERDNRERDRDRESRKYNKEKKDEATEPDVDPERDQRTVFAYQICLKADERDVYEFFSRAGKVRDVRLIMDRNSRRSKGVGYIEFYDVMSVPMAIALSGQPLLGQPVMVKPSEAEKNLVQSTTAVAGATGGLIGPYSGGARRLYVGNLHTNIKEEDLRQVFGAFGLVELVQLPVDENGHCKGFGFVQFGRLEDARNALSLNGQLDIGGRTLKVSAVTDQPGALDAGGNTGDFDDDEGGGLALNARSRALLMQKLDRSGGASNVSGSLASPSTNSNGLTLPMAPILGAPPLVSPMGAAIPALGLGGAALQVPAVTLPSISTIGVPSECLQLKNMFDPASETEPDFELDIKDDVQEECSKFGSLKHIYVDKFSAGFVFLRFENTQAAQAAQHSLHGRWFAGKMITASFMSPQDYEAKFPDAR